LAEAALSRQLFPEASAGAAVAGSRAFFVLRLPESGRGTELPPVGWLPAGSPPVSGLMAELVVPSTRRDLAQRTVPRMPPARDLTLV